MTGSLYLRLKSLNTRTVRGVTSPKNIVRVAAMHNLREIQAELGASAASGINPARMHLNYQLRGPATADEVAGLAVALLDNAGVKALRRDACMALELVISLPAGTAIDHREYFGAAVAWADAFFSVPILSAAVHLDEAAPHLHVLLLPLVAGRMQGGALAGGPAKIRAMLADFQQQVAQRFGLKHQPRTKRLSKANRDAAGRVVLEALRARPERLTEPGMRDALIAALGSQAETLLPMLGLSMPAPKATAKSFVQIMTAPCKPERARRVAPNAKHIDVAQNLGNAIGQEFDNVYVSVDVAPARDISLPITSQPTASDQTANASTTGNQLCATTGELSAAGGAASVHIVGEQQSAVELASGLLLGTTIAGDDSRLRGNQRTAGQQASASSAVQQATGAQQRERSTTGAAVPPTVWQGSDEMAGDRTAGDALSSEDNPAADVRGTVGALPPCAGQRQASTGVQNILHTPLVASTNPVADQEQPAGRLGKSNETLPLPTASTVTSTGASPRKRATKPAVAAAGRPAAKRAAGTALRVDHGEQHDQVPGQQQAGQHLGAPVHASARTPENSVRGDAGPVATAAAPARNASRGQNGPDPLPIVPSAPVGSSAGKGKLTAPKVGSASTAPHQPASTHGPEDLGTRPPSPFTNSTDQAGQAFTTRKRNAKTAGAKVATTTAAKPAGPKRSAGGVQSLHPMVPEACSTVAKPARSKRATKGAQSLHPLSPDASTTAAKRRPASSSSAAPADEVATCTPLRVSSSVDGTDAASPGLSSASKATTGTAAPARRERVTAVKPGKSRNKSHVPGDEELSTTSSQDLGESPNSQDVDQPDEIRTLGAGAGPLSPSSEIRTKPAYMHTQAPPIGGPWDCAGMLAPHDELAQHDEADDYQRHRDDDHAAEHWDEQRGEFVTAPVHTRSGLSFENWIDGDFLPTFHEDARPAIVDAALASIQAACFGT